MGRAIRAFALILCLACSAQAGWMHCDVVPPPPPDEQQQTTDGETEDGTADGLTQTVLDLLADLLTRI